jgi:hypothetical protein
MTLWPLQWTQRWNALRLSEDFKELKENACLFRATIRDYGLEYLMSFLVSPDKNLSTAKWGNIVSLLSEFSFEMQVITSPPRLATLK